MLNFVLKMTGSSKLIYLGHSMGTTAFFTMMNLHPEMANRIYSAHLLAPGKSALDHMIYDIGNILKYHIPIILFN